MYKSATLFTLILIVVGCAKSQEGEKYSSLVHEAWKLYESADYLESGQKYSEAFAALDGKGMVNDRYNAACSWALANRPDSAFIQLIIIAENGNYANLGHIITDPDLNSLHKDSRWASVIELVKSNMEKPEVNLDRPLAAKLDSIYQEDQMFRLQINEIEEKYGRDSDEMKEHWQIIQEKDSLNLIEVVKILDTRGWLGSDVIGIRGNQTLFLVVQHSDQATQEKYLPMMRQAVKDGKANARSLALLEDRVAFGKGEKQVYGSQIGRNQETGEFYIRPLIDPDNVNTRRAEVGLGPIEDYISNWEITWDVEEYKRNLPMYESMRR